MTVALPRVDHVVPRSEVVYSFSPQAIPVLEVAPGAVVTFETQDCFGGQLASADDLVTSIDFAFANPATGPVAIRGAEPGDSLIAEILSLRPGERGFTTIAPLDLGSLPTDATRRSHGCSRSNVE